MNWGAIPEIAQVPLSWPEPSPMSLGTALRGALRGVVWRVRWLATRTPWKLSLGNGFALTSGNCESGERIYRYGSSEPETAAFLAAYLKPGMTYWDAGAHSGEFSLIAAKALGRHGMIRAYEPHPETFSLLEQNLKAAACRRHTSRKAVAAVAGTVEMVVDRETARLRSSANEMAQEWLPAISLDDLRRAGGETPDLVRISAAGAERLVLEGASRLLDLPVGQAPVWLVSFRPLECERYGYDARYLLAEFGCCGYACYWLTAHGLEPASLRRAEDVQGRNLVAVKREAGPRA